MAAVLGGCDLAASAEGVKHRLQVDAQTRYQSLCVRHVCAHRFDFSLASLYQFIALPQDRVHLVARHRCLCLSSQSPPLLIMPKEHEDQKRKAKVIGNIVSNEGWREIRGNLDC